MLVLVSAATLLGMMRGAAVSRSVTSTAGFGWRIFMTVRGVIAERPSGHGSRRLRVSCCVIFMISIDTILVHCGRVCVAKPYRRGDELTLARSDKARLWRLPTERHIC